jgi:hypothetical protein
MSNRVNVEIDSIHSRTICKEIGERLRISLWRESPELPPRMGTQLDQLRKLEASDSPSIVPSIFGFGDKQ